MDLTSYWSSKWAATPPLRSCDHISSTWQLPHIYDRLRSHDGFAVFQQKPLIG